MGAADELKRLEQEAQDLEKKKEELYEKIRQQKKLEEERLQKEKAEREEHAADYKVAEDADIFRLIVRTLGLIDKKIMQHSCRVAYIYMKMLEHTRKYSKMELAQYAVLGLLHDLGEYKIQNDTRRIVRETNSAWTHSIYSYLYIRNFSPLGEKGNVVLYHHIPLEKFDKILTSDKKEAVLLAFADKLERRVGEYDGSDSTKDLFESFIDREKQSEFILEMEQAALDAIRDYNVITQLTNGEYEAELYEMLGELKLVEEEKRKYLELLMYAFDFQTDEAFLDNIRTIQIAKQIGEVMLVSEYEKKTLLYGALLYDIGKFAMPLEILRKPGKLTDAEMEIIRSHTAYTEYLLGDFFEQPVINIAARHHEKMDGSGYPRHLKGADLTLCERILAVADIVSALSADRSYRKAMPKAKILEILHRDVENNKLCPHVVNALMKKYDIIMGGAGQNVQRASKAFVVETAIAFRQLYNRLKTF